MQDFAIREWNRQRIGQGARVRDPVQQIGGPTQEAHEQGGKIGDRGQRVAVAVQHFPDEILKVLLLLADIAREDDLGIHQRGGGYHQAIGLQIAQPGLVIAKGVIVGHLRT